MQKFLLIILKTFLIIYSKTENEQKTENQNKSRVSSFIMNSWITTTYGFERFKKEVTWIVDLINNLIV